MGLRYLGNINKPGYNPLASNITTGVNVVQYQGIFTTQQQLQAITTGQWVTDPLFDYSTLLLQADGIANGSQNNTFLDSSTNNFTITRNGNTTQGAFSPFSLQPGAWGNYFNGSSSLDTSSTAVSNFGTGAYTVEFWIYLSSYSAGVVPFIWGCPAVAGPPQLSVNSTGTLTLAASGGSTVFTTTSSVSLNTWTHVALVRTSTSSNGLTCYFNGIAGGTGTDATNWSATQSFRIATSSSGGSDWSMTGYLSNFRVCKAAVYTGNFTPSTTALTTTSQGASSCVLLACQNNRFVDNSSTASTFTITGTPSVQPFSPFAPQYQWTSDVIGGSGYFDGTGDYLQSSGDFFSGQGTARTFQCWIYVVSMPGAGSSQGIFSGANSGGNLSFRFASDGTLNLDNTGTANIAASSAGAIKAGQWTHVAVTRTTGNLYTLYVNGSSVGSGTNSTSMGSSTYIASLTGGSTLNGYMAGVRVTNTVETISVPTTPPTAITGTALLLNFTNAGIYDGTMKNNLETVGNAQISTSVVKYGSGSMYFDGSGDWLVMPSNPIFAFPGQFTIEFWLYRGTTQTNFPAVFCVTSGLFVGFDTTNSTFGVAQQGVSSITPAAAYPAANTWVHIAVTRDASNLIRIFYNGVQQASGTIATSYAAGITYVGKQPSYGDYNGYIDDLRITQGIARYTQNFIPPSVALPRQ